MLAFALEAASSAPSIFPVVGNIWSEKIKSHNCVLLKMMNISQELKYG